MVGARDPIGSWHSNSGAALNSRFILGHVYILVGRARPRYTPLEYTSSASRLLAIRHSCSAQDAYPRRSRASTTRKSRPRCPAPRLRPEPSSWLPVCIRRRLSVFSLISWLRPSSSTKSISVEPTLRPTTRALVTNPKAPRSAIINNLAPRSARPPGTRHHRLPGRL